VSADDLARALGGTTPEPAPKPLAPAVPQGPDFGLKEVRARDAASALLAPSFFKRPSPDLARRPRAPGAPTSYPPSRPLLLPPLPSTRAIAPTGRPTRGALGHQRGGRRRAGLARA
jgi:hypothetical protein